MVYVQFPTYKVQQLACNKICKQISCFLTQLTVTADRIHTFNIRFIYVYIFVNSVVVLHLFPDTSIKKENEAMNQHTVLQKDKTTTGCASIIDLFFQRLFFSQLRFLRASKRIEGQSSDLMMKNCLASKRTWSKLNTVYWTFTVLYFTVELGWHAFYNQLLFTKRNDHFFPQSESLSISDNKNNCGESDAKASRFYEICPWQFAHLILFYTQKWFLFLLFFLSFCFFCLKQK